MNMDKLLRIALLSFVSLLLLNSCSPDIPDSIHGVVREVTTDKPIEEAIVIVRWFGEDWIYLQGSKCFHVDVVKSDENGQFTIIVDKKAKKFKGYRTIFPNMQIYKAGFQSVKHIEELNKNGISAHFQKPFKGSTQERFDYLSRVYRENRYCPGADKSIRTLSKLYYALHDEAMSFSDTEEEKINHSGYKSRAEELLIEDGVNQPTRIDGLTPNL